MSCHVMSCHVMSCHVMSCHVISDHIISYHIISYHIISYHIISYHIISYHIISYHIKLYSNIIHQNKSIKHNMILRTWSKGQKAWDNHALTKVSTNIQTCKNTLYTHTDKNTQEHTRHAPKWNQLYSDNKTESQPTLRYVTAPQICLNL